ncbi:MAG: cell surface protein SprA [Bacteroidia bacterium]|nr:cell surface protein SprA [Bacteroidia bacterium]
MAAQKNNLSLVPVIVLTLAIVAVSAAKNPKSYHRIKRSYESLMESVAVDTPESDLHYPFPDYNIDPNPTVAPSGMHLNPPSNVKHEVEFDPESGNYNITDKVGNMDYRPPTYLTFDEYQEYNAQQSLKDYWKKRSQAEDLANQKPLIPKLKIDSKLFEDIFGSNTISIKPQGTAELIFGFNRSKINNPSLPIKQRKVTTFNFDQKIQLNVTGEIGDKIKLNFNYNTEATFDFENQIKLGYTGKEDEIIQKIELGNVQMPTNGTLINGSQSLFGGKVALKFGKLGVTGLFAQQRGKSQNIQVQGGSQITQFDIPGDSYEAYKHFFLSQYFRKNYDKWCKDIPLIGSPINITRIEVWVTNKQSSTVNTRDIVCFMDLGENPENLHNSTVGLTLPQPQNTEYPGNKTNYLYDKMYGFGDGIRKSENIINTLSQYTVNGFINSQDYVSVKSARKLVEGTDFTYNSRLGYISLSQPLNPDEVLGVSYQYTIGNEVFQVGEFSQDVSASTNTGTTTTTVTQDAIILKMLKSNLILPKLPTWHLMMKNVYNLGAYSLNKEDFQLNVIYDNISTGTKINFIPEGKLKGIPLIRVLNTDSLNFQLDKTPDGVFDYIDGITINSQKGTVIFPVEEPFGSYLREQFGDTPADTALASTYVFEELYDSTRTKAIQNPLKNRFRLMGSYKSASGSDISLNATNIPQGSVKVTSGGVQLQEGVDYSVDYTLGRVKIINQQYLNSNQPLNISLESQSLFNIQTKRLIGTRLDYKFSKDLAVGATLMNLQERPLTQKVNIGDEAVSNTVWGVDGNWRTESRLLTKLVDKIPFINTKETSTISFVGEFAQIIPGNAPAIGKDGTSYIDDFEGSQTLIDIQTPQAWTLASTPQGQPTLFPEATVPVNDIRYGMNRAHLGWYQIDASVFFQQNLPNGATVNGLSDNDYRSNHYSRQVLETELFPNKQPQYNQVMNLNTLDLHFNPKERGPYNYDVLPQPGLTAGIDTSGRLKEPQSRWAGITRKIETPNFEENNIEYIQLWVMDPYYYDQSHKGGDMYINLGTISEDLMRDGKYSYENGLSTTVNNLDVDSSKWGYVPAPNANAASIFVFDNDPDSRTQQDVGTDGLSDEKERLFFNNNFLQLIKSNFGENSGAYIKALADPSTDDYRFYLDNSYNDYTASIIQRYQGFNGYEGNSPVITSGGVTGSYQTTPNLEDINRDNTIEQTEQYYQYKISLRPQDLVVGKNYITDKVVATGKLDNNQPKDVTWYQFKIPVRKPEKVIGEIGDYRSIRFIRTFLKNFEDSVTIRFGKFQLVRGEWRKFEESLEEPGEQVSNDFPNGSPFDLNYVNIEENGNRVPIKYKLPPGIEQQQALSTTQTRRLNEQSLALTVCELPDGVSKAAFRTMGIDTRTYKHFKMFVHAEKYGTQEINDGDLRAFVRFGTDFTSNYYEYEIPLKFTPWGSETDTEIWPSQNEFDFDFSVLTDAKKQLLNSGQNLAEESQPIPHGNNFIRIKGTPNLGNIKIVMVGVRNPKKTSKTPTDDGKDKCAILWFDEMRLTEFMNNAGWATNLQLQTKLADFANITATGHIETVGWGQIQEKVSERNREDLVQYDVAGTFNLDKFFPKNFGLKVPMYLAQGETWITPYFSPLQPDLLLSDYLNSIQNPEEKKYIKEASIDYTIRRGINFTNVQKQKSPNKKKSYPWDISNISLTYAYNETKQRNFTYEYKNLYQWKGAITYNYNLQSKNLKPFPKLKLLKKIMDGIEANKKEKENDAKGFLDSVKRSGKTPKAELKDIEAEYLKRKKKRENFAKFSKNFQKSGWWKPIKDINFTLLPSNFSFNSALDRQYNESLPRNTSQFADIQVSPQLFKNFIWQRVYSFKWDLTKSLSFDYTATNNSRIDEDGYRINKDSSYYKTQKDSIWKNLSRGGRNTQFHHTGNVTYALPINKFPITDWITSQVQYTVNYDWTAPSQSVVNVLGNSIQNSRTKSINGNFNFVNLYNKVGFLKKANQPPPKNQKKDIKPKETKTPGKEAVQDSTKKKKANFTPFLNSGLRFLMMVRSAGFDYSEQEGILLPGFKPTPSLFGNSFSGTTAPGWEFVFGSQNENQLKSRARENNWLVTDPNLNNKFTKTYTSTFNARSTIEPIPGFKIDLTATRNYSRSKSEFYRWDEEINDFNSFGSQEMGNYNVSIISASTAFGKNKLNSSNSNQVYEEFRSNLLPTAQAYASKNPNSLGNHEVFSDFPKGYGKTQQDVLINSFLTTYTGSKTRGGSNFPNIPMPNWRVNYDGLMKIGFIKNLFKNFTLSHQYRSTYSVNSFTTNLLARDSLGSPIAMDSSHNYIASSYIPQVSITEQFSPFIGVDMTWQNSLTNKFEYKKGRTLSLSTVNNQLTEVQTSEISIGAGYRFKNVVFPIRFGKNQKKPKSDVNLKADVAFRNNQTVIHRIVEGTNQASAGQQIISIKISADYVLSEKVTLRAFYDQTITKPVVSSSFPTNNANGGISLRLNLAQ